MLVTLCKGIQSTIMNVIITGAARGIGKAVAMAFAKEGANLILCSKNEKNIKAAAAEIQHHYDVQVQYLSVDLAVKEQAIEFAEFCLQHGTADVLVNNAGLYLPGSCLDSETVLNEMMNVNFYSAVHITRTILPAMVARKSGHIFFMGSIASVNAYKGGGSYSISKFALNGFSKNLRLELLDKGVKVTNVYAGAVFTDSWGGFDNTSHRIMEADDVANMIIAAAKLSPAAVVEDIILRPQLGDL